MKKLMILFLLSFWLAFPQNSWSTAVNDPAPEQVKTVIALPKPDRSGGKPLMEALWLRKSTRSFSNKSVSEQDLSNLLWAAWGINRPETGKHTAPTSRNEQNVQVYVALESGVWLYDPAAHGLKLMLAADTRAKFGGSPITLLFAAEEDHYASGMHVGSLYQSVGLYCASAGLANVVKLTGANALDGLLKLPEGYRVFIIQSVGWPR